MSLRVTCPSCGIDFPVEAGLIEGDAKRLAAVLAGMDPLLGRATLQYLHLFKPAKTSLRISRAIKVVAELADLADAGTVCRDERAGVRRPASPALWAAGIEQMLAQRERLELPLANHNYLRTIVYSLADAADAVTERQRESDQRNGRRSTGTGISPPQPAEDRLINELRYQRQLLDYGQIDQAEYDRRATAARSHYGASHE